MPGERTEKPTGKRRDEARKKGQVARSNDVNGAVVTLAALLALSSTGPKLVGKLEAAMYQGLTLISTPDVVSRQGIGTLLKTSFGSVAGSVAPIAFTCMAGGLLANVAQNRPRLNLQALKPDPKRISPVGGIKRLFGPSGAFEAAKGVLKVIVMSVVVLTAILPNLDTLAGSVGMSPQDMLSTLGHMILTIAKRAALAYVVIAAIDYVFQRWRHEKGLKMSKEDIKEESKAHNTPPEVRAAIRRRQLQAARARMMAAVPQADVVVTNPTHFAVALAYDGTKEAPEVLAKGPDLVALQIRRIAEEHGVPIVEDPPLARSLYASVEVGRQIPEEFFQAVAQLLAFVYRMANRRSAV
jgi:flagellar biosynthesis protein FlhB